MSPSGILISCFVKFWSRNRRNPWRLGAGLSGESLSVIRGRKDILHKFFERSRRAVLRRTRLLRSEDSRIDGLEHLDVHLGFPRRKTRGVHRDVPSPRSEEHTSELQSHLNLVFP